MKAEKALYGERMNRKELIKCTQDEFNIACDDIHIESLKVWNCKIKDFSMLQQLINLVELEIFGFENGDLRIISKLNKLKKLRIIHMPQINDLSALSSLKDINELALESLPSWDASGRTLVFKDLVPLADMSKLMKLTLMKVKVKEKGLLPLSSLLNLKDFFTDNTFTADDFALLSNALPNTNCKFFKPYNEVTYAVCRKCKSNKVLLTGIENNELICPNCQSVELDGFARKFNKILENRQFS